MIHPRLDPRCTRHLSLHVSFGTYVLLFCIFFPFPDLTELFGNRFKPRYFTCECEGHFTKEDIQMMLWVNVCIAPKFMSGNPADSEGDSIRRQGFGR